MGFFKRIFSSKHKESSAWRGTPRPSTSGTATARSTATVSQSPRSISSATTTNPAYFAPLENIGSFQSYRPRTAASTKISKETGRPATSDAATTNPSFPHHEVEAFYPPCPTKPGHLDGLLHPAYHKVLENDRNSDRCTTKEGTDRLNLRRSPPKYQQRPQLKENDQRRAADKSVLSTKGQNPEEPSPLPLPRRNKHSSPPQTEEPSPPPLPPRPKHSSPSQTEEPPLPPQPKHSSPSQTEEPSPPPLPPRPKHSSPSQNAVVSSGGTSSSPYRNKHPRRCKDDNQARPGSSSTTAATLDTSRPQDSRDSDATTLFSDSECETGIATEELDFPALLHLGRNFGVRQSSFDWSAHPSALRFTKRCIPELKNHDPAKRIEAIGLLQAGAPSAGSSRAEIEYANKAWSLLSPDEPSLRIRHITDDFCLYFFHVFYTLGRGKEIPFQVPVRIRAKFIPRYRNAWNKFEDAKSPKNHNVAKWIGTLDGEKQGTSLIALLEITMDTEGPLESRTLLRTILNLTPQVKSLRHVSEDQISNFFATLVRAFRTCINDSPQALDEVTLEGSLAYFSNFWSLCTAQYCNHIAGNYLSLFEATIRKLENIDIPLCLWTFLAGSGTSNFANNMEDPAVGQMYVAMETELNLRLPSETPCVVPIFMTVQFLLSVRHVGFFEIMHGLMHAQRKVHLWQCVWRLCRRSEFYALLSQHTEMTVKIFEDILPLVMASR